jgi:NAD(P)H-dependent FMN reductase
VVSSPAKAEPLMPIPKILVVPGSIRTGSHNVRLAALAAKELTLLDVELPAFRLPTIRCRSTTRTSMRARTARQTLKLKQMIMAHQGVFIASKGTARPSRRF